MCVFRVAVGIDARQEHWINGIEPRPIANPMSVHPYYAAHGRKSWGINGPPAALSQLPLLTRAALGSLVVEVEAEDGTTGVGGMHIAAVAHLTGASDDRRRGWRVHR